ncbi:hypothetical protein [Streptomyces ureilyticus]|uniref:Uncharacterized protein n=1 Tax=Streptomyces ureilyticus TaxID=1775131 RepID=A0ABX0DZC2_9ACTN|nr:hypothetical protein [Streptomyces ureilyticus]NGO47290.1 hypothetical protein [Streptomyces ureilyticus]
MSVSEQLFIKTEIELSEVAELLARTLQMEVRDTARGTFLAGPLSCTSAGEFGGKLSPNKFSTDSPETEDVQAFDGYPILFDMWLAVGSRDDQQRLALEVMRKTAASHDWPLILLHDLDLLVARWDPDRGWQTFPPGTSPDVEDIAVWG